MTRPLLGSTSPLSSRANVDFPEPLLPIRATRCSVSVRVVG
jgi:hypothetical protein